MECLLVTDVMTNAVMTIEWGEKGLNYAIDRGDNVVIIDQLRFSSTVVTAVALGFVIEPTSDKSRRTESFSLSPFSFIDKPPRRVVIRSPNGAYLSINAKKAKNVVYGSLLNASSVGEWINKENKSVTLVAAGEVDKEQRTPFVQDREIEMSDGNEIFAIEDFIAAGAISSYSTLKKTDYCLKAEDYFNRVKGNILNEMLSSASHRYNDSKGRGKDTEFCSKLNVYDIVPKLYFISDIPEIK